MQNVENEQRYKATILMLIDRLAASQTALHAVDECVDVFADLERGKSMLIAGLCNRGKIGGLQRTPGYSELRVDTTDVITKVRNGEPVKLEESAAYTELRNVIYYMAKGKFDGTQ